MLQKMKISSLPRIEPRFFDFQRSFYPIYWVHCLGALNYRPGNLGNNAVKASVINISPFCNVFYIYVLVCVCRTLKPSI